MMNFRKSLKVNVEPKKKTNSVDLIMQYMEKEKDENRMFDEADGIDIYAEDYKPEADAIIRMIENMLKYRELRTEQAFVSKMNSGNNSREIREKLAELDKDRREKHNLALSSLKGLNEFAKRYGLEPIYTGRELTEEQIESHDSATYDTREEMTDAFLKLLIDIEKSAIEEYGNSKVEMMKLQKDIDKTKRQYGVKKELEHDDGNIEFNDMNDELQL